MIANPVTLPLSDYKAQHVRLPGALGPSGAFLGRQDTVGIDLPLELREEGDTGG